MVGLIAINYYNLGIALFMTLVVEVIVIIMISGKNLLLIGIVIVTNLITNPTMNLLLTFSNSYNETKLIYLLELVVIIVEGTIYYVVTKNIYKAFAISTIANVCSYAVGMLLIPIIF